MERDDQDEKAVEYREKKRDEGMGNEAVVAAIVAGGVE